MRLEHDPSPTESDLLLDLENAFDDDVANSPKVFVARSASFNGPNGAFVPYLPKRSSSFCESSQRTKAWLESTEDKRPVIKKKRRLKRERRIDKTDRGLSVRRLSDSVPVGPEPRATTQKAYLVDVKKNEPPVVRTAKPVKIPTVPDTFTSSENIVLRKKEQVETETVLEIKIPEYGATSESDVLSPISEQSETVPPKQRKSQPYRPNSQKGALAVLLEKNLQEIKRPEFSDGEVLSENPFRNPSPPLILHKRPQKLKVKVGFESSAIGQGLDTAPTEANTEDKTLPYYLKSSSKVSPKREPVKSQRIENNIEYEKSIELGQNILKISEKPPKTPEPVEIQYFIEDTPSPRETKKSEIRLKIKIPKPDYSNEIREEVEPITPDTDQSELEEIIETFSKEVRQSDIDDILSGDESRRRTPRPFLETAFLSSPKIMDKRATSMRSGRESAPIFRRNVSSPAYASGRQSVPVDHPQALRTRSLSRDGQNAKMAVSPNAASDPKGPFTPSEIEAIFWDRLKQKKIRDALREQQLLNGNSKSATVSPGFQREYENYRNGAESPVPRSQSALDFTKKKDGLMSKLPFFGKRRMKNKEDGAYKKGDDVTVTSLESPKTVSFDQTDAAAWNGRNGESVRPLPPVPLNDARYGVISKTPVRRPNDAAYNGRSNDAIYGVARAAPVARPSDVARARPGHLALRTTPAARRISDTESGSEAGEVQRIMMGVRMKGKFFSRNWAAQVVAYEQSTDGLGCYFMTFGSNGPLN